MTKITKEYANTNNGGRERVTVDGGKYYINSYINANIGWMGSREVSRSDVASCMAFTNAPADVVVAIMGTAELAA